MFVNNIVEIVNKYPILQFDVFHFVTKGEFHQVGSNRPWPSSLSFWEVPFCETILNNVSLQL